MHPWCICYSSTLALPNNGCLCKKKSEEGRGIQEDFFYRDDGLFEHVTCDDESYGEMRIENYEEQNCLCCLMSI